MNHYSVNYGAQTSEAARSRFMAGVYKWMTLGLLLTALVSYYISNNEAALRFIFGNSFVFFGLIIAQLGAVLYLSFRIQSMSA